MKTKNIEDIYPLTIVRMRFKDKIIIFNCINSANFINTAVENEEISYDIENWLEREMSLYDIKFGIGNDIWSAFEDYKIRE